MLKPPKCLCIKHFNGFSTFKISCFPIKIQSKTHAFSNASFRTSFFEILMRLDAKKLDFESPLAPSWAQNAEPHRPSCSKKAPKTSWGEARGTDLLARSLSELSLAPFWLIWDGFWMNLYGFDNYF